MTTTRSTTPIPRQRRPRARVTGKFQVTIPSTIRRSLGLAIGDILLFRQEGNRVVLSVEPKLPDAEQVARELGYASALELARALEEGGRVRGEEARAEAELWMAAGEEAWRRVNLK